MAKPKKKPEEIIVWTDGSAKKNPGPGGYAFLAYQGDVKVEQSQGYFLTTNNRMEIMAVIAALEELGPGKHFNIHTDSQFVIDSCTKWIRGWARNNWVTWGSGAPVKNPDLWKVMLELLNLNKVKWTKVKAHSGIPDNEYVDVKAKEAADNPEFHDTEYSGVANV